MWSRLPHQGPRRTSFLLGRIAAKEAIIDWVRQAYQVSLDPLDLEITLDRLGRPVPALSKYGKATLGEMTLPAISISHSGASMMAAAAEPGAGIDVESLIENV